MRGNVEYGLVETGARRKDCAEIAQRASHPVPQVPRLCSMPVRPRREPLDQLLWVAWCPKGSPP